MRLILELARSNFAAVLMLAVAFAGCAARGEAGSPPAKQPQPETPQPAVQEPAPNASPSGPSLLDQDEGPPLTTIEAAEAEFARVEREFDGLWPAPEKADKAEAKPRDELAGCDQSCKAFLSLERAAAAICRLAGDADSRCTRAKKILEKNRQRMADCACS
jgi:hypothetical protein